MAKWKKLFAGSWKKELLMSFFGTTLSIVFTFGTASYLERKQQRADGRQTAMMVIIDIEKTANRFNTLAKREERNFAMTQTVLARINEINSIGHDTLNHVLNYITDLNDNPFSYDDSSERVIFSSQEVWKDIDNARFMDLIQHFFYRRREVLAYLKEADLYTKPISGNEVRTFIMGHDDVNFDFATYLVERLTLPQVTYYLNSSFQRIEHYKSYQADFTNYANNCKFMMDISDEEYNAYVAQQLHSGHRVKPKQLYGTWLEKSTNSDETETVCFAKDHTFTNTNSFFIAHPHYAGRIEVIVHQTGTWQLQGDSLLLTFRSAYEYDFDRSAITILPDKQHEADSIISEWEAYYKEVQQAAADQPDWDNHLFVAIDGSGRRIKLVPPADATDQSVSYMTKQN